MNIDEGGVPNKQEPSEVPKKKRNRKNKKLRRK